MNSKAKPSLVDEATVDSNDTAAPDDSDNVTALPSTAATTEEELDADEQEFNALRRDLPGVKGVSAAGIVTISVGKVPTPKNEFFRTNREFRPIVPIVNVEVGMEHQYFVVTPDMVEPLNSIGITVSDYTLYLTVTPRGAFRIIPAAACRSICRCFRSSPTRRRGAPCGPRARSPRRRSRGSKPTWS